MTWKITLDDEFKKNEELKGEDIEEIHKWMKQQPHLPSITGEKIVKLFTKEGLNQISYFCLWKITG